jgi:hypothetical protein
MLRWVGNGLLGLGVVVGGAVGVAMLTGVSLAGVSWLVAVGVAKLTLIASAGLMAGGALCLRLDHRERKRLAAGDTGGTAR